MFLRIIDVKRDDRNYKYLKLVETLRDRGKVIQKTLLNFGNVENWPKEKLREFVYQLNQFCDLRLGPGIEDVEVRDALDFGSCLAIDAVWRELELSDSIRSHMKKHPCEIDIVPAVKAMVFNRLLEPSSKLRVYDWIKTQAIDKPPKKGRSKKPEKVKAKIERYLRRKHTLKYFTYSFTKEGTLDYSFDDKAIDQAGKTDGILILLTNFQNLTPDEVAQGYRTLSEVENAFKEIKHFFRIRPIYHYKELRVRAHVFICVLAYLIEKFIEKKLTYSAMNLSPQKALQKLKPLKMVTCSIMGKPVNKTTKIVKEQKDILNALGVKDIPKIQTFSIEKMPKNQNVV